jgi:methionine synthase II (cobalamin-independent)
VFEWCPRWGANAKQRCPLRAPCPQGEGHFIDQAKTRKPVRFGTCCSQVRALFLDIHTAKYKDKRQVIWDMAEAMNKELLALRDAGCRCIQIEEPTFHFMANTYGKA